MTLSLAELARAVAAGAVPLEYAVAGDEWLAAQWAACDDFVSLLALLNLTGTEPLFSPALQDAHNRHNAAERALSDFGRDAKPAWERQRDYEAACWALDLARLDEVKLLRRDNPAPTIGALVDTAKVLRG